MLFSLSCRDASCKYDVFVNWPMSKQSNGVFE